MSGPVSFVVRLALGLGVVLGGALAGSGDPDEARSALEAGRAALGRKDWSAAATHFQRSLDEDGTLLEAWLGLGEAFSGGGDRAKASQSFRSLLGAIEELPEPSDEQRALYTKARKRATQLGRDDATLDGLVRKHADALAALSVKWATKDPAAAAEAARAALRIAPDHAKEADLRARATQGPTGKAISIFNGRDGVGFEPLTKEWKVQDGLLIGEVREGAYLLSSQQRWAGDYDVAMEASVLESYAASGPPMIGLLGAFADRDHHVMLACLRKAILWRETFGPAGADTRDLADLPLERIDPKLAPTSWIRYEMRFRSKHIIALVAGKEIARIPRPKERPEGPIVLNVQCCKAAIRRLEVTPR